MNCEHIKELLSAYLDAKLAPVERQDVLQHLSTCDECRAILDDYRRFDALLANLPRVSLDSALHDRIFSSPAYQELVADSHISASPAPGRSEAPTVPHPRLQGGHDNQQRPHLIALPGGRAASIDTRHTQVPPPAHRRQSWVQRTMQIMIAATLLLTVGVVSLIGWNLWQYHPQTAALPGAIIPPAGPAQNGPLPAGTRFTFLRDGALWSAPSDGSTGIVRLTPAGVTVATNWTVRTALPGHTAGNVLAYVDLKHAYIHTIRSDSQNDGIIHQPLLKSGVSPATIWNSNTGMTILHSLRWSQDGNTLAFVADPQGSGQPELYLYSTDTANVHAVSLPQKGAISHLAWSPDSKRLAFVLTHNGQASVLDYNIQNNSTLVIAGSVATKAYANDTVLQLDWAGNSTIPTITWSVGATGHVHTIWSQQVGLGSVLQPHLLTSGDFVEATLNHAQKNTFAAWLLTTAQSGIHGDAIRLDLQGNILKLTSGKQVNAAQWSPDNTYISYLDSPSAKMGALHILNIITGSDILVASDVVANPAAAWSQDTQRLAYSTGSQAFVVNLQGAKKPQPLKLQGSASALTWSITSSTQLVIALSGTQQGIYLIDTQHSTSLQLDKRNITSPILWTQIS